MITTVKSWAAIQARIAEWQRQDRNSDDGQADFLFGLASSRAEYLKWLRSA